MSGDGTQAPEAPEQREQQEQCMPCRGTGRVISRLGGTPHEVTCPWCRGGGMRLSGVDAEASWRQDAADGGGGHASAEGDHGSLAPPAGEGSPPPPADGGSPAPAAGAGAQPPPDDAA